MALQRVLAQLFRAGSRPWLLIYDNVEKPQDVAKLMPSEGAHVLVTTRFRRFSDDHGFAEIPVGVFPRALAIAFLTARAPPDDPESAGRLADALGCLPLALEHAASYCRSTRVSFDQYRSNLPDLIRNPSPDALYRRSVFATFDLAIARVAMGCPAAAGIIVGLTTLQTGLNTLFTNVNTSLTK